MSKQIFFDVVFHLLRDLPHVVIGVSKWLVPGELRMPRLVRFKDSESFIFNIERWA